MDMLNSLVGAGVEYSDMKKTEHRVAFEKILKQSKLRITKEMEKVYSIDNRAIRVPAMAEMYNYYMKQDYALSIRSHINLRRNKGIVEKYLTDSHDDREERLINLLKSHRKNVEYREVIVIAVFYFVGVYKSRLPNFKPYLTKEEFFYVA